MPVPPEIDKKIRDGLESLYLASKALLDVHVEESATPATDRLFASLEGAVSEEVIMQGVSLHETKTHLMNMLPMLFTDKKRVADMRKEINLAEIVQLHGMIAAIKRDYEDGMLDDISEMIEANVVADYLTQAEQLLRGGKKGVHTYGPAAVLAGAVLEDGLRRLCARQTPPISTNKPGGHPKTMGTLIDALKSAGLFNELKAKQLRAWADIRNAAAHGRFNSFNRADVEQMLVGVQTFLADHL